MRLIGFLALPGREQVEHLERLRLAPLADELALQVYDHAVLIDQYRDLGLLSDEDCEQLRALDRAFASMTKSDNKSIWTTDAVLTSPEWDRIRRMARSVVLESPLGSGSGSDSGEL